MNPRLRARLSRIEAVAWILGGVALVLTGVGAFVERRQFFFSYLFGYTFWLGLSLGCLVVFMIHQLTGGRWGYPTRRFFEAGFMALPLMLLLFVPILFGLRELYPWARPDSVAAQPVLQQRHPYQNSTLYIVRTLVSLLVWIGMSRRLRRCSLTQDTTTDALPTRQARFLSGPGLVLFTLLATFAYVDWIMSLEPHWYSTMFAVIIIGGQILVAFAFGVILLTLFRNEEPLVRVLNRTHYHHLGNLLLTFVLFWTYVSFGQLLIIYSGDLPQELDWYLHRIAGDWKWVVAALGLFHFFLPFFLLLFRSIKRHVAALTILAALIFVVHVVDAYWLVMPTLHPRGISVSWLDFLAPLGIGGVWVGYFLSRLKRAALVPQNDPGLQFAFTYGH